MYLPEFDTRPHGLNGLFLCRQNDAVNIFLPGAEGAPNGNGAGNITSIAHGRFRTGVIDRQVPLLHDIAVELVVKNIPFY